MTTQSVHLYYEGTCNFLRGCSKYSKGLPSGEVQWGCTGRGECSDSDRWLAGPDKSYCGKSVKLCAGGTCTTGIVRDVSNAHGWEGGNAVLDDLGLSYGLTGKCSGFGGGQVSISVDDSSSVEQQPTGGPADAPSMAGQCTSLGGTCAGDEECCSQSCIDGVCGDMSPPGDSGNGNGGTGTGSDPGGSGNACTLAAQGDTCYNWNDCCSGVCTRGVCGCVDLGNSCSRDENCCQGACGMDGVCQ